MVPVNLRPLDQACKLGNRSASCRWCCRSASTTRSSACTRCAARMNALKGSYQPLLAFGVLAVAGLLIKPVQDAILNLFAQEGDRGDDQRARARASR